jgi:hypothetical protein
MSFSSGLRAAAGWICGLMVFTVAATAADSPSTGIRANAISQAKELVRKRNFAAAEQALAAVARTGSTARESDLAVGHALAELAFMTASAGDSQGAQAIASQALRRLTSAASVSKSEDGPIAANARQLAGLLQERFLGDHVAAKALYRQAMELDPNHRPAVEALAKLEKAEEAAKARPNATKKPSQ